MMQKPSLIAKDISLFRGNRLILKRKSFCLKAGEMCIIRGANGAGKSSFLACLAGLTQPDSGTISSRPDLMWVGHKNGLKARETVRQHIQCWGQALGASHKNEREAITQWALTSFADLATRHLSQGQKRRTALARLSLAFKPLWLLDEPFAGLDSKGIDRAKEAIATHIQSGGMVVMALHNSFDMMPNQEIEL